MKVAAHKRRAAVSDEMMIPNPRPRSAIMKISTGDSEATLVEISVFKLIYHPALMLHMDRISCILCDIGSWKPFLTFRYCWQHSESPNIDNKFHIRTASRLMQEPFWSICEPDTVLVARSALSTWISCREKDAVNTVHCPRFRQGS